jgi:hypothetical protein
VITLHELSFRAPVRLCSRPSLRRRSGTLPSALLGDGEQGRTVGEVEA